MSRTRAGVAFCQMSQEMGRLECGVLHGFSMNLHLAVVLGPEWGLCDLRKPGCGGPVCAPEGSF